jgi:hypothetical protein
MRLPWLQNAAGPVAAGLVAEFVIQAARVASTPSYHSGSRQASLGPCAGACISLGYEAHFNARHRFPPDVIRHAVWLYLRFTLSYIRDRGRTFGAIVKSRLHAMGIRDKPMAPASLADAGLQKPGFSPKISLDARSCLQHLQRPTPTHFSKNSPSLSRVGYERVARRSRGRLKIFKKWMEDCALQYNFCRIVDVSFEIGI